VIWELPRYLPDRSSQTAMGSGAPLVSREKKRDITPPPSFSRAPLVELWHLRCVAICMVISFVNLIHSVVVMRKQQEKEVIKSHSSSRKEFRD